MGIRRKIHNIITNRKFNSCGSNVYVESPLCLDYSAIEIGDNVHILRDSRIQNVSGNNETRIKIGDNTGIQYRFTILAGSDVIIGRDVAIASDVFLSSGNHGIDPECNIAYGCQPYLGTPIKIEDGAWLGEKVTVLSGVTIGKKSIIGSGSVVTRDIPAYCVAVGNPARVIKKYNFHTHQWEVYNLNET